MDPRDRNSMEVSPSRQSSEWISSLHRTSAHFELHMHMRRAARFTDGPMTPNSHRVELPTQPQKARPQVTPRVVRRPCAFNLSHTANDDVRPRRQLSGYEAAGNPNVQIMTTPLSSTMNCLISP
eukprot:7309004-Prymnesium_polylepis.1